jgi:hypothetical protein
MDTAVHVFYEALLEKEPLTQVTVSAIMRKAAPVSLLAAQHGCSDRSVAHRGTEP